MPQHIGIVGCSAEGASLCYRTICTEGAHPLGAHGHPEVSLHTPSLAEYVRCLDRGDWQGVAELMLGSAHKLSAIGADFLICPDNTIHQAFPLVAPRSPLPWLHIAKVVATQAAERGFRRLGLIGTRWLVESDVYPDKLTALGLQYVRPDAAGPRQPTAHRRNALDPHVAEGCTVVPWTDTQSVTWPGWRTSRCGHCTTTTPSGW
jgi:aspartate racemase